MPCKECGTIKCRLDICESCARLQRKAESDALKVKKKPNERSARFRIKEMKEKLTEEQVIGKMSINDVVRYYFPEMGDKAISNLIWNSTCYPFSTEIMLDQIYQMYVSNLE